MTVFGDAGDLVNCEDFFGVGDLAFVDFDLRAVEEAFFAVVESFANGIRS